MSVLRMLCLAGIAATLSGPALATTYDGVADYGTATNPTGVWSYRDGGGNLLTSQDSTAVGTQWYTGGYPGGAYIVANKGSSSQTSSTIFYAANSLHLDGQSIGAEVRFAAPSAGIYSVSGQFEYGDTNMVTHTVKIVDNSGTTLFTYSLSNGATQSFSLPSVSLATDGYLDFITTADGGP